MNMKEPLSIFMINYDWRDIFRTSMVELKDKLERDRLNPGLNDFFFFSWANASYEKMEGRMRTVHRKTHLYPLKPVLDAWAAVLVPFVVRKYRLHPRVWMTYDFGMLPALRICKMFFGGTVVLCLNNQPRIYSKTRAFGGLKSFYSSMAEKLWWVLADHFFTINENLKAYLMDVGVPPGRITVFAMNTIDRDLSFIAAAKKGVIRAKYSIPGDAKIVLTVARLEAEKNYPQLLELFAGLGPGHVLICLGRGSLLESLKAQARKLGIEGRVFFPGFVHREEIWNYYADADAFVLLSKAEALGVVFWEAMHMGVPVIGSDADGIVETVGQDKERGRIWRERDGQAGFNQMMRFCFVPGAERDAMLQRAKEYVNKQRDNKVTINDLPFSADKHEK